MLLKFLYMVILFQSVVQGWCTDLNVFKTEMFFSHPIILCLPCSSQDQICLILTPFCTFHSLCKWNFCGFSLVCLKAVFAVVGLGRDRLLHELVCVGYEWYVWDRIRINSLFIGWYWWQTDMNTTLAGTRKSGLMSVQGRFLRFIPKWMAELQLWPQGTSQGM